MILVYYPAYSKGMKNAFFHIIRYISLTYLNAFTCEFISLLANS